MLKIIVIIFFFFFAGCQGVTDFESGYVVHGPEAALEDYPWQAAIFVKLNYRCLGVLIDKTHVLTTNKCLTDTDIQSGTVTVNFGVMRAADATNSKKATGGIKRDITADLAIIEIEEVTITSTIRPIAVLHKTEIEDSTLASSSGWGYNNTYIHQNLHSVELEVTYNEEGISSATFPKHACIWDQGTGLTAFDPVSMNPTLIGIAKHNKEPCSGVDTPSLYISTFQNKDFINSAIKP